jgi:hypothetical protein
MITSLFKWNLRVFVITLFAIDLQLNKKIYPKGGNRKSIRNTNHDATVPQNLVERTNYSG